MKCQLQDIEKLHTKYSEIQGQIKYIKIFPDKSH